MIRFIVWFVVLLGLQFLAISLTSGSTGLRPLVLYAPFVDLVAPFVKRHYGHSEGSLGPLVFWGVLVGALAYSAALAGLTAFLTRKKPAAPEPDP